jgi:hypothetical protein
LRCRCCTDAASQHEHRYKVPPCGVWAGCTHTHRAAVAGTAVLQAFIEHSYGIELRGTTSMCVCVCATGHLEHNLEHWKLHIGFDSLSLITRGPRPTIRVKTRTAGRSGPRSPRRRPARAGRGRDQSDGPSGRSGAVRAFFHVSANFTRSHVFHGSAVWTVRLRVALFTFSRTRITS